MFISSSTIVRHTRLFTVGDRTFPVAARTWNSLPQHVTSALSLKLGIHYPCSRAVFIWSAREHGCDFLTPVFTGLVVMSTAHEHGRHLEQPCPRVTGRRHSPWTRVVFTELTSLQSTSAWRVGGHWFCSNLTGQHCWVTVNDGTYYVVVSLLHMSFFLQCASTQWLDLSRTPLSSHQRLCWIYSVTNL